MPKTIPKSARQFSRPYRVTSGRSFRLKDVDPADTAHLETDENAKAYLAAGVQMLTDLQERLWAADRWGVLMIFQAMDAAGKDSTIKHVMSGVNPQGVHVNSFKAPSGEELDHDFLWRTTKCLPERGRIGIFNRSYYEDVLVVRVHPELLENRKLPDALVTKDIWKQRFEDIRAFERYLARNGYLVLKFFLHISREEQRRRFLSRLDEPAKNWKFSAGDVEERRHWNDYMAAYEDMIQHTSARHAPWYVVPADHKWFARLVVASALIDGLESLDLELPSVDATKRRELSAARIALEREKR